VISWPKARPSHGLRPPARSWPRRIRLHWLLRPRPLRWRAGGDAHHLPILVDEAEEGFGVVEAVAVVADQADLGVEFFEPRVFQAGADSGDDLVLVYADRAGELDERLGPAAARGLAPAVIVVLLGAADVVDGAAGGPALWDGV